MLARQETQTRSRVELMPLSPTTWRVCNDRFADGDLRRVVGYLQTIDDGYEMLWIAHWTTQSDPIVPGGAWGANGWTFWQYTSSGVVPGIAGRVDLNRFNGSDLTAVRIP